MTDVIKEAVVGMLRAIDANREAVNGHGHPDEGHDVILREPGQPFTSTSTDCAACGGAEYSTEDELHHATGDLREAVGEERKPWER